MSNEGNFEIPPPRRPRVDDNTGLYQQVPEPGNTPSDRLYGDERGPLNYAYHPAAMAPQRPVQTGSAREGEPFTEGVNYWPPTTYVARSGLPTWLHLLYAFVLGPVTCGLGWVGWLAHWLIVQKKTTVTAVPPPRDVIR